MWQIALTTAAWDIAASAISLAIEGELRAARILNRSIFEYGIRLHHYCHEPGDAEGQGSDAIKYLRHVMRAVADAQDDLPPKRAKEFRRFLSEDSAEFRYGQVHMMMRNTLRSFGFSSSGDLKRGVKRLESEYAVSSGVAHGSQGLIFDVFRKSGDFLSREVAVVHERRVLVKNYDVAAVVPYGIGVQASV
jgi:hypothetical protein